MGIQKWLKRKQAKGQGYANLIRHFQDKQENYEEEMLADNIGVRPSC